jgi:hypothetical protein
MTHEMKTWPIFFRQVKAGRKSFEVRRNDRDFHVGDVLILQEYDPAAKTYTGDFVARGVTYLMEGMGLEPGYVAMAIVPLTDGWDKGSRHHPHQEGGRG